jgi:hypothetical protein
MIERIYKYMLKAETTQLLELPAGAYILSVAEQHERIVIYAQVKPDVVETDYHMVWVFGTGHDIDHKVFANRRAEFLGTVKMQGGALMFHVYVER